MKLKTSLLSLAFLGGMSQMVNADCPGGTEQLANVNGMEACSLQEGIYKSDLSLTPDKLWVLRGKIFIGEDGGTSATLYIDPGTRIVGSTTKDVLVINRGSKIHAEGTRENPIVFTTINDSTARGQWGGLVINGRAPINTVSGQAEGEGNTGFYGGDDPDDNSGILKFVRVEYAGHEIVPDKELNGIAFQGVGRGTVVDYIQVHKNSDDGVEFFGGTVDAKHIVLTGNKDDSLDWTFGWSGRVQFVIVQQFADRANNGIEADSSKIIGAMPRSNPMLSNMTFLGANSNSVEAQGSALLLRRGTGAEILNSIFTDFNLGCIDIDDAQTVEAGMISFFSNILFCRQNFEVEEGEDREDWNVADYFTASNGNMILDPMLNGFVPQSDSPALVSENITPLPLDGFFDAVNYIGAVRDAEDDWYKGWTRFGD